MLFAAIALIVVGALLLAFVHPADHGGRRLRNLGAGALIVVGVVLLVVVLAGVLDTETDVDAELLAPVALLRALFTGRTLGASPRCGPPPTGPPRKPSDAGRAAIPRW